MKNITVKQYSQKPDIRYQYLLNSLEPKNMFAGKESHIGGLSYLDVINWYTAIRNIKSFDDMCKLFTFIFCIEEDDFWNENVVNFFAAKNFIEQDFINRQKKESKVLKTASVDPLKWKAAGGDSLNNFSPISPLDDLAKRYGGYPFEYGDKPYDEVFSLLVMITRKNMVAHNYQKLLNE